MRRDTVCRSMYSDMSKRRNCTPSVSASCLASSVLPTPVGPANTKLPIGRLGIPSPARFILIAWATRSTARSWPKILGLQIAFQIGQALAVVSLHPPRRDPRHRRDDPSRCRGCAPGASAPLIFPFLSLAAAPASSMRSIALSGNRRSFR